MEGKGVKREGRGHTVEEFHGGASYACCAAG